MKILELIGEFIGRKLKWVYDVIDTHKNDFNNPHQVDKEDVGLGNVDNTSDKNKPMSDVVKDAIGGINTNINDLGNNLNEHVNNSDIHHTTENLMSIIGDAIESHDHSSTSHTDIRNEIRNIIDGKETVGNAEYAEKLGDEEDFYTKQTLDQKINKHIKSVDYATDTAVFTFTYEDGTTTEIDTPVEGTVKDGWLDSITDELVLVLVSGQEIRIPLSKLVKIYTGKETPTTTTTVSTDGKIGVDLNNGAVEKVHLSSVLLAEIQSHLKKTDDLKDNIVTFTEAGEVANIESGDDMKTAFGKIKKWFGYFATQEDVEGVFNKLVVNLDLVDSNTGDFETQGMKDDIASQMSSFEEGKPVVVLFNRNNSNQCVELGSVYEEGVNDFPPGFRFSVYIHDFWTCDFIEGNHLTIIYDNGAVSFSDIGFRERDILFLYDEGNGEIPSNDLGLGNFGFEETGNGWQYFCDCLYAGKLVSVYLWSIGLEAFVPATYNLTPYKEEGLAFGFTGFIEISYLKDIDGVKKMCREKRIFGQGEFNGAGSAYTGMGENGSFIVEEFEIGGGNAPFVIDASLVDETYGWASETIADSLLEQFNKNHYKNHFIDNPKLIVKYEDNYAEAKLLLNTTDSASKFILNTLEYRLPSNMLAEGETNCLRIRFRTAVATGATTVLLSGYDEKEPEEILFLQENNDNIISIQDYGDWDAFSDKIKSGEHPVIYLKSETSDRYCVVQYQYTLENGSITSMIMEIEYPKNMNGKWEAWIERRVFSQGFFGKGSIYDGLDGPEILKFPLIPEVELVSSYPTDLSSYGDGAIFILQAEA